ncbi:MAG: class I SAM-dependent methyltransferase [Candidatus Zixiibacteriota bacterium]|nr:MAG: class I SAM-dependent methyltransferase [candidate division Zixibacteria bacterium]
MKQPLLYRDFARYYDLIYAWKDFGKEAGRLKEFIARHKKSDGNILLDAACGTGRHLKHLKNEFKCTGVDINRQILGVARRNASGIRFLVADIINLDLGKSFDIILCLFSSIGYVRTYRNLKRTVRGFSRHLKPGGVVLIEPWFVRSAFRPGAIFMQTYDGRKIKISRLTISKARGNISIIDMHYLVAEQSRGVRHFAERHEMGLFETEKTLEYMKAAGLKARFLKNGLMKDRGLFVGVKL